MPSTIHPPAGSIFDIFIISVKIHLPPLGQSSNAVSPASAKMRIDRALNIVV